MPEQQRFQKRTLAADGNLVLAQRSGVAEVLLEARVARDEAFGPAIAHDRLPEAAGLQPRVSEIVVEPSVPHACVYQRLEPYGCLGERFAGLFGLPGPQPHAVVK